MQYINYIIFAVFIALLTVFVLMQRNYIKSVIDSAENSPSSKRFITVGTFLAMLICVFSGLFLGRYLPDYMWYGLVGLVAAGIGVSSWEKVKMNQNNKNDQP